MRTNVYLSWWVWLVYALLLAAALPWYWQAGDDRLWWGMPAWAAAAVAASAVASLLTAVLMWCFWPADDSPSLADPSHQAATPPPERAEPISRNAAD
jgi:hypothetical protein